MTDLPLVSIIFPTYNNSATLPRALDSMLAQDYANTHIVVVDDCSSDDTVAVAQAYAARHPRITVQRNQPNRGLVGNFSTTDRFIKGKYFVLAGHDDTWDPRFLSAMVGLLEADPKAQAALPTVRSVFEDGETELYQFRELQSPLANKPVRLSMAILFGITKGGREKRAPYNSFLGGAVARSSCFPDVYINDRVFWYIEMQLVLMFVLLGGIKTIDEPWYTRHRYRQTWAERYPDDTYVPEAERLRPRVRSALRFLSVAMSCKRIPWKTRMGVPLIFLVDLFSEGLRPTLVPRLRRILPASVINAGRKLVYGILAR